MFKNLLRANTNNRDNAKNGLIHGCFNMIANIFLPFVSRTFLIHFLGTQFLGIGGLFSSILNVLNISELGVGAAISFMLYKPVADEDIEHVNNLLNFYKKCYRIIGCVVLILGLCCMPFLPKLIKGAYPDGINLYIIFLIFLSQSALTYFLFAYKTVLLIANQRYDIFVFVQTLTKILTSLFQIIILIIAKNYYAYIIILPFSSLMQNFLDNYFVLKLFPQYKAKGKIGSDEKKEFSKKVIGAFSTKIGEIIYLSADQIIISAFLGLTILGIYTNYYYIITSLIALFAIFHNTMRPILGRHVAVKTIEKNFEEFRIINYGYGLFSIWCSCCLLILYQPFMKLWVGKDNIFKNHFAILFSLYFFIGRLSAVLGIYRDSCGIWWQGKYISLVAGIGNLLVNITLIQFIGLEGVLIASIVTSTLILLPGYFFVLFKSYFTNLVYKKKFIIDICWLILDYVLISSFMYFVLYFIKDDTIWKFVVKTIVCGLLGILILILTNIWNRNFGELLKSLKKFIIKN